MLQQQLDHHAAASSMARSHERRQLETEAITRCLGIMIRQWQERGDYLRLKVMELLLVKGWANRDVAAFQYRLPKRDAGMLERPHMRRNVHDER